MADKIGVYFDESGPGQSLDLAALTEYVEKRFAAQCPVIKTAPVLATDAGHQLIQADIDAGTIDSVLVCGSSPRVDSHFFSFNSTPVERVNLREHVALCTDDSVDEETRLGIAKDYLAMGVIKLQKTNLPTPETIETQRTVLVIGGGWTGLHAASHAAHAGNPVILIEKAKQLGGKAATMHKSIPLKPPYLNLQETGIAECIAAVEQHSNITVYTNTTLTKLEGSPGTYTATLSNGTTQQAGAVVLAAGWLPGNTDALQALGYGTCKNVITTAEMEKMVFQGDLLRPSDGKPARKVAFLLNTSCLESPDLYAPPCDEACTDESATQQAATQEEEQTYTHVDLEHLRHLPYSSAVNAEVALKQALYVRNEHTTGQAYIIYEDMMVQGIHETFYKRAQVDPGVMLTKGIPVAVTEDTDGSVLITVKNTLIGDTIELRADVAVLPTSMVPATAKDPIVNLDYRQGPNFPDLELFDGYADSNYICFPYETRRTGIYAAGAVRQPMLMDAAAEDAAGAALKAIQCIESAHHGVSVHPRSGDLTFPEFNFVRCTQCKRCTEECPFGALDDDEKGTPKPNSTRCRRCGTCMGACPERVISFADYNIDQIGSMIKAINVPDDMAAHGPRIVILACENDAYPAMDMAALQGQTWSPYVRIVPVRCLGSVNAIWVADAMSKGIDGVMMLGCKYGDDYQCHFVKGSEICNRRKENIAETLERLGVEPDRVEQYQVAIDEYEKIPAMINEFQDMIIEKGPNPFKGF